MTPLAEARHVSLESYRKDGSAARVPVWIVESSDTLCLWTHGDSHKARRVRRNPEVAVAPCDARGSKLLGPWRPCRATVLEDPGSVAEVRARVRAKYGWHLTLILLSLRLRGMDPADFVLIELRPQDAASS